MKIDPTKLSKEVSDKYSIVSNAFKLDNIKNPELDKIGEPKDKISVIVGDDKQPDFLPQVKLERWSNEVNFSVRLKDEDTINTATVSTDKDKIVWDKGNIKIENYDYTEGEGGYKFVWYLKSKPPTNKVEFTIQSKGLDFFYQPELTPEEIAQGAFRPENVVGSYAVYHQTKGGMNDSAGKEYKTGKAFHIYRSKATDANGNWIWEDINIDTEKGILTVTTPQDFLDKAVYPIKSNSLTFGYTSAGATLENIYTNWAQVASTAQYTASSGDTITSFSIYTGSDISPQTIDAAVYSYTTSPQTRLGTATTISITSFFGLYTSGAVSIAMTGGTTYVVAAGHASRYQDYLRYDTVTAYDVYNLTYNPAVELPATWTGTSTENKRRGLYATYTAAASGPANLKSLNTNLSANIKSVNTNLIANCKSYNTNV